MGFIDKAIDKARTDQFAQEQVKPPGSHKSGRPVSVPDINFARTRIAPVDRDFMRRHKVISGLDNDPVTESYKLLRTQVLQRIREGNRNTLMVTGPTSGEGKSLTAINLAVSIARGVDKTVLLVDADLQRPTVHRYFGWTTERGLADYFSKGTPVADLLVRPEAFPRLVIMPGGQTGSESTRFVTSPRMQNLINELKTLYQGGYVIFDLPPLLSHADALALAPLVDGIVLVAEMGRTSREAVQQCLKMLAGLPVLGFVLNKTDERSSNDYYHS
jgi:capsular exopolysaccharide synthesis family protein